jgi:hypothetical protein
VEESLIFICAVSIWLITEVLVDSTVVEVVLDVVIAVGTRIVVHTAVVAAADTHIISALMTSPVRLRLLRRVRQLRLLNMTLMPRMRRLVLRWLGVTVVEKRVLVSGPDVSSD